MKPCPTLLVHGASPGCRSHGRPVKGLSSLAQRDQAGLFGAPIRSKTCQLARGSESTRLAGCIRLSSQNAADIVREKSTTGHHNAMIRYLRQLLLADLQVVVVLDGARWPLKSVTHTRRASARAAALEKADAAVQADDWPTAEKFYNQAVRVPTTHPRKPLVSYRIN